MNMEKGRVSHGCLSRFPHGEVEIVGRRTVGTAFVVLQGLLCQSVKMFAPQESVAGLNRPPGVVGPRSEKTGR